jgi:predicted DNA-binding protein with PD1-like motif
MRTFVGEGLGRIVVLNLERGEKLLEGIREQLEELGIREAVLISAIGTLTKAVFHRVVSTAVPPQDEFITLEGPIELSTVQGMVVDGEPHFHLVFSDLEKTYSGHLEDGSVVYCLAEVVLAEIEGLALRRVVRDSPFKLLEERS